MNSRLPRRGYDVPYFAVLWLAAAACHRWVLPLLPAGSGLTGLFWRDGVIKNIYWTLPALLFMAAFPACFGIRPGILFRGRIDGALLSGCICASICLLYTIHLAASGGSLVVGQNIPAILLYSVCAGTTEEFVFRGFLLNYQYAAYPGSAALLLNAGMFVLIHYTGAQSAADFLHQFVSLRSLLIFGLGLALGGLFLKTRNLAAPMLVHIWWDILSCWWGLTG